MNKLLSFAILLLGLNVYAQDLKFCPGPYQDDKHKEFNLQKNFTPYVIEEKNHPVKFSGLLDSKNDKFHLTENLTDFRTKSFQGEFYANFNTRRNKKNFLKYCKLSSKSRDNIFYKKSMGDEFIFKMNIFPKLSNKEKKIILSSGIGYDWLNINIKFDDSKDISTIEHERTNRKVKKLISQLVSSIDSEKANLGLIELDFSGLNEVVCDLLLGDAQLEISVNYSYDSQIVTENKNYYFSEKDQNEFIHDLASVMNGGLSSTDKMFYMTMAYNNKIKQNIFPQEYRPSYALSFINFVTKNVTTKISSISNGSIAKICVQEYGSHFSNDGAKSTKVTIIPKFNYNNFKSRL